MVSIPKEDELENQEEGDLYDGNDTKNHIFFGLLEFFQVVFDIENQKSNGINHSISHQQPLNYFYWYDTQEKNHDEAAERVPIQTNHLFFRNSVHQAGIIASIPEISFRKKAK